MGCDIHGFVEVKRNGKWEEMQDKVFNVGDTISGAVSSPFYWRSYSTFAFLADVRNYSHVPSIAPDRGLPEDSDYLNSKGQYNNTVREDLLHDFDYHSCTWLLLSEISNFDYDQTFENRRYTKVEGNCSNGAAVAEEGKGEIVTYKEFLSESYFQDLEILKTLGVPEDVRIVIWFDN